MKIDVVVAPLTASMDGPRVLAAIMKFYTEDIAIHRKLARAGEYATKAAEAQVGLEPPDSTKIIVAKTTRPLFDFDKEVKEAYAAYPALKKKYNLPNDVLPVGGTPPAPKGPPMPPHP